MEEAMARIQAQPGVLGVQPNYLYHAHGVPNDPNYPQQWGHPVVNLPLAWDKTAGRSEVVVAILDTGTTFGLGDFSGIFASNPQELADGIDNDGNGYIDDIKGWDFVNHDNDPTDDDSHGTFVTSVLAALRNNGIGIAGVAGGTGVGSGVHILPVKILNQTGQGSSEDIAAGIRYAKNRGASILNMSLGQPIPDSALTQAIQETVGADVLVVASAGNGDIMGNAAPVEFPAAYQEVIAVGALQDASTKVSWSNIGNGLDLMAPGVDIKGYGMSGDIQTRQGTSFAAPMVAGIAALLKSMNPFLSATDTMNILQSTATDLGPPGEDTEYGYGRVDAQVAMTSLLQDNTAPTIFTSLPLSGGRTRERQVFQVWARDNRSGLDLAGSTLSLLKNGVPQAGTVTALDGGQLRLSLAQALPANGAGDGPYILRATLKDHTGNQTVLDVPFTLDATPPLLQVQAPPAVVGSPQVAISFSASDIGGVSATVNGLPVTLVNGTVIATVPLAVGANQVTVHVVDDVGNVSELSLNVAWDAEGPVAADLYPAEGSFISQSQPLVGFHATDALSAVDLSASSIRLDNQPCEALLVNGEPGSLFCRPADALSEGEHDATLTVRDNWGNTTELSWSFVVDLVHPSLTLTPPPTLTRADQSLISGTVGDSHLDKVTAGGKTAFVSNGQYTLTVNLTEGANILDVVALDKAGNTTVIPLVITKDTLPPQLTVSTPSGNLLTNQNPLPVQGFTDGTQVFVNNLPVTILSGAFSASVTLSAGASTLQIIAKDPAGNASLVVRQITLDSDPPVLLGSLPTSVFTRDAVYSQIVQATGATLLTAGPQTVAFSANQAQLSLPLLEGLNVFDLVLSDAANNKTIRKLAVVRLTENQASTPQLLVSALPPLMSSSQAHVEGAAFGNFQDPTLVVAGHGQNFSLETPSDFCVPTLCAGAGQVLWFSSDVALAEGYQAIPITINGAISPLGAVLETVVDRTSPGLSNLSPPLDGLVKTGPVVSGVTEPGSRVSWLYGIATANEGGAFSFVLPGNVTNVNASLLIRDTAGNSASFPVRFLVDSSPPKILGVTPASGTLVPGGGQVTVTVFCEDCVQASFLSSSAPVVAGQADLQVTISLPQLSGLLEVRDAVGNVASLPYVIVREAPAGETVKTLSAGWNLLGLGQTPLSQVLAEVGAGAWILKYDPVDGYQIPEGVSQAGQAYWVLSPGVRDIHLSLPEPEVARSVDLQPGWNLVSFSRNSGLPLSAFQWISGVSTLNLEQAVNSGALSDVFLFDGVSYQTPNEVNGLGGFFIHASTSGVLNLDLN